LAKNQIPIPSENLTKRQVAAEIGTFFSSLLVFIVSRFVQANWFLVKDDLELDFRGCD